MPAPSRLAKRRWLLPLTVVLSLAPFYAFMAGVPNPWVFAPRYAHHALPYAVLVAAYALWAVPHWLLGVGAKRRALHGVVPGPAASPAGAAGAAGAAGGAA